MILDCLKMPLKLLTFQQAHYHTCKLHDKRVSQHNTTRCFFHLFTINIINEESEIIYKI